MSDGAGGYTPGKIILDTTYNITKVEWSDFISDFEKLGFWNLPTQYEPTGTDGAKWILEAKDNEKYHVVIRWSPEGEYDGFWKSCMFLIKLAGLDKTEEHIY
jgi:hypothetical protein